MLDYGTLREKLIICILCLSGIREGHLCDCNIITSRTSMKEVSSPSASKCMKR